jgi:hypothetical protein
VKDSLPPAWQAKARAELERQADTIDAATQSRLNRARQAALAELGTPSKNRGILIKHGWWGGTLATATACSLVVALWLKTDGALEVALDPDATDSELLADQAELEFFNELEFYSWLVEEGLEPSVTENTHET